MSPHSAWRNWYHCTVGTYGTWLPGDPRGWRERDHHEHVPGDYKHPPPPTNFAAARHSHSQRLLRSEPYTIQPADRRTIGKLLLEDFTHQHVPILALAVTPTNFHALLQCLPDRPKSILGHAKCHATLNFAPIVDPATNRRQQIWESQGAAKPIRDRDHALSTFHYIIDHLHQGAWVWSYHPPKSPPAP